MATGPSSGTEHEPSWLQLLLRPFSYRFALALLAVALGAAGFGAIFRWLLMLLYERVYSAIDVVSAFRSFPIWGRVLLPVAGGLLAGLTAVAAARIGGDQGLGAVMEAVVFGRIRLSMRFTLLRSLGSWIALATGGAVGREGPIIQFGGSLGKNLARGFELPDQQLRALIAAGTAAGFASAYNTPLAAVLFVLEVVTGIVALDAILPVVLATALATTVTRLAVGGGPIYGARAFLLTSRSEYLALALLALLTTLVGQAFMRLLAKGETLVARQGWPQPWCAAAGGLAVGAVAAALPEVVGNGYEPLNAILDGALPLKLILVLIVAKAFATTASVSTGSPGGVFTPTLLLGAAAGAAYAKILAVVFGHTAVGPAGGYALVGMAAMLAATTHAPIMSSVLVFELSGDYAIVIPLMLATGLATALSRRMRADSVYTSELRRRGVAWELTLEGRRLRP